MPRNQPGIQSTRGFIAKHEPALRAEFVRYDPDSPWYLKAWSLRASHMLNETIHANLPSEIKKRFVVGWCLILGLHRVAAETVNNKVDKLPPERIKEIEKETSKFISDLLIKNGLLEEKQRDEFISIQFTEGFLGTQKVILFISHLLDKISLI